MPKPKILVARAVPPNVHERVIQDYDATMNVEDRIYSPEELLAAAEGQAGILSAASEKFSAEIIAALPESVKIISTFSVGYDHLDVEAARARGIVVTNTPDVLTEATAEFAGAAAAGAQFLAPDNDRSGVLGGFHRHGHDPRRKRGCVHAISRGARAAPTG